VNKSHCLPVMDHFIASILRKHSPSRGRCPSGLVSLLWPGSAEGCWDGYPKRKWCIGKTTIFLITFVAFWTGHNIALLNTEVKNGGIN
jgi:hypothetical protein